MLTSKENLYIEAIATSTRDLSRVTNQLNKYGLIVDSSEIITSQLSQPWGYFEFETSE